MVPVGVGTFNSRSVVVGGSAVKVASARVGERVKEIAAFLLDSDVSQVELAGGRCRLAGSSESVSVEEVARRAWTGQGLPSGMGIGLEETEFSEPVAMSSPYGAHIAVVEVDRETVTSTCSATSRSTTSEWSSIRCWPVDRSTAVSSKDSGSRCSRAPTTTTRGHPVADPPMPRFDMVPRLETSFVETPAQTNPLGAKGVGEAGAIAAPPTIVNAVIDALRHLGVREMDMPLTPERVLHAIEHATPARGRR